MGTESEMDTLRRELKEAREDAIKASREARQLKKDLHGLTKNVLGFLNTLDMLMKEPEGEQRGRRIALISNALDFRNDSVRHFTLGLRLKPKPTGVWDLERVKRERDAMMSEIR